MSMYAVQGVQMVFCIGQNILKWKRKEWKEMECNDRNGMEWNVMKGKSKQVKNRYYR